MKGRFSFRALMISLWVDRGRAFAALVSAVILWYLIGQRLVVPSDPISLRILDVRPGEETQAGGLYLTLPDNLVLMSVSPEVVQLRVSGSKVEIDTINAESASFRGFYELPRDVCGPDDERTVAVQVTESFEFPSIEARPDLRFVDRPEISVTVARRESVEVELEPRHLAAEGVDLEGVQVTFSRATVVVGGPKALIDRIIADDGLLRSDALVNIRLADATAPKTVALGGLHIVDDAGVTGRGLLVIDDGRVEVTIQKERVYRDVALTQLEVLALIPSRSRRENVDWEAPLKIDPPALDVALRVPEEYFSKGLTEADLRRDVMLYVNLGDREASIDAGVLSVRRLGVPENAAIKLSHDQVDVEWQFLDR